MGTTEARPALLATIGGTPVVRLERLAGRRLGPGAREATPYVDSGLKYLAEGPHAA